MKNVEVDLRDDWKVWDGVEPVTLEVVRRSDPAGTPDVLLRGGQPPVPGDPASRTHALSDAWQVRAAKRRALTVRDAAASGGVYTSQDIRWHIPAVILPEGLTPRPGDAVVDGEDRRWVILDVAHNKRKWTWSLTCRDLVLSWGLHDRIAIERPAVSYDGAGAAVLHYPTGDGPRGGVTLYGNLPARVQETSGGVSDERGVRGPLRSYEVWVDRQVAVSTDDRILWRGRYLDVTGWRDGEQITGLPLIEAQDRP